MNTEKVPFVLNEEDRRSAVWARLMRYMNDRLAELRLANDADKTEIETAKLRGQITEIKAFLRLNEEKKF